jgi:hypothetical protein
VIIEVFAIENLRPVSNFLAHCHSKIMALQPYPHIDLLINIDQYKSISDSGIVTQRGEIYERQRKP